MKIIKAIYGYLNFDLSSENNIIIDGQHIDVTDILNNKITDNKLVIQVNNDNFTDPINGTLKSLYVKYEYNDEIIESIIPEGEIFNIPETKKSWPPPIPALNKKYYNILLLTSCNRIKQVLLSLSINYQIIKEPFCVIIVDSSTPNEDAEIICKQIQWEDPYNKVKVYNYCSNVDLLYDAQQYFPNIQEFKVIHFTPRLMKQRGESTSIALGLMQAALMGNRETVKQNYCLKLTGTSILKYDILSELNKHLENNDVITWHRSGIGGFERTTRIFGCRPDILSSYIATEGWSSWCDDQTGIFEQRFAKFINKNIPDRINYTGKDENGILLEGYVDLEAYPDPRSKILNFIKDNNIDVNATPYLKEFMEGGIWTDDRK